MRCLQHGAALTPESTCERLGKKAKPGRVTHSELSNLVWVGAQKSLYPAHPGWSGFDLNWYLHRLDLIEKGLHMSGSEPTRLVPGPNTEPSGIALAHAAFTVQAAGGACQCAPGAEYMTVVAYLQGTSGPAMSGGDIGSQQQVGSRCLQGSGVLQAAVMGHCSQHAVLTLHSVETSLTM